MTTEHFDVLIVGAGISGIGAAHHLQERCPGKSYAVLEARGAIGGTWDLFRYPGIRSDSDMHTLGYRFRPWTSPCSVAEGSSIREYIEETARDAGIDSKIRFHHRVAGADWSSRARRWTVEAEIGEAGERATFTCDFLYVNSGYYRYDEGYSPEFPGRERFEGPVIHPQHWPEDFDHRGTRVVVIGSGATAATLVPALARDAAHVIMLQRSPSYVVQIPGQDPVARLLRGRVSERVVHSVTRWKNALLQTAMYRVARKMPRLTKLFLRWSLTRALPEGYDIDAHFTPSYEPWDQRPCLIPDSDLFDVLADGSAEMVTDRIETFTEDGIRLESGRELEVDAIVAATGLNLLFLGGIQLSMDGQPVDTTQHLTYKGLMLSDVPNLAFTIGYTSMSWTLKADLTAEYVCRLLNHMDAEGRDVAVPELADPTVSGEPLLDLRSNYVLRALSRLPKQGSKKPWRLRTNYPLDLHTLRYAPVDDGVLRLSRRAAAAPEPAAPGPSTLAGSSA